MYRVTDLNNTNEYTNHSNFYDLKEAQSDFNFKKNKGLNVLLETIKFKVLICDSINNHDYSGYDYYVNNLNSIDFIIQSLLLGKDHIELYKVIGDWRDKETQEVVNLLPILDNDLSIESLLYHGFNKIYPQSSFLSNYIVKVLDTFDLKMISKDKAISIFDNLLNISFCNEQKEIISDIKQKYVLSE